YRRWWVPSLNKWRSWSPRRDAGIPPGWARRSGGAATGRSFRGAGGGPAAADVGQAAHEVGVGRQGLEGVGGPASPVVALRTGARQVLGLLLEPEVLEVDLEPAARRRRQRAVHAVEHLGGLVGCRAQRDGDGLACGLALMVLAG